MLKIFVSVLLLFVFVYDGFALSPKKNTKLQESLNSASKYSHLCLLFDLYGLWEVVKWIPYYDVKPDEWRKNPKFRRKQWVYFNSKGNMKILGTDKGKWTLDDVRRKLSESELYAEAVMKRKGFFSFTYAADASTVLWRCSVADIDFKIPEMDIEIKKGDVIMTMLDDTNTIRYFRQLRAVNKSEKKR